MLFALGLLLAAAVLYFLSIMPRIVHRPDRSLFAGRYFAHRGLHDNSSGAPENSLAAFRRAVENGYGIELDVQLSKDGIPVVFHDFLLKRVCGVKGRVRDYTLQELKQFRLCGTKEVIPALSEVLDEVKGKVPLIVELKLERHTDISVCPAADRVLSRYEGSYCIESFNPLALRWYRKNRSGIVRGQLSEAFLKTQPGGIQKSVQFILEYLMLDFLTAPDFIAYNREHENNLSLWLCRKFYHCKLAAWTVRSQAQLDEAKKHFDVFIFQDFIPQD